MIGSQQRTGRQRQQRLEDDVIGDFKIVGDGNVDIGPSQHLDQVGLVAFGLLKRHPGILRLKSNPQFRHHERRNRHQAADRDRPPDFSGDLTCDVMQGAGTVQHLLRGRVETAAARSQGQASRVLANEQFEPEDVLQLGDRRRNRGRRHVDQLRRCRNASGITNGHEVLELSKCKPNSHAPPGGAIELSMGQHCACGQAVKAGLSTGHFIGRPVRSSLGLRGARARVTSPKNVMPAE